MTEFPTGLILANCIFKGFFRRSASIALPRPSGDPINSVFHDKSDWLNFLQKIPV
jgi:hypothetical protein